MSTVTPVDPIEKLFVNTRGQISDQFRLRKLKMRLGTVGDITAMTAEQFTGLFGSDYMRVVGNRLRKNGLNFRPVEDSALYREGVDDPDFRIRLYSIGVGSLAKLSKISLAQFLHYLARLRESRRLQYSSGVTVLQFGAVNYRDDKRRGLDVSVIPVTLLSGRSSRAPHPSWVVDGTLTLGLSKVLYGSVSDVQRGVMVGVVAVPATEAVESRVIAVSRVHVSATVAFLTRVGGVYH